MTDTSGSSKQKSTSASSNDATVGRITLLDLLRVLTGLLIVSSGLSYMVTGDSLLWGYRPWFTHWDLVKAIWEGPLMLTDEELRKYDGSDPNLPVYLALNGTIYDVSAGRTTYGPGGSYHFFAGRDATRAFLTGCFQDDLTPDLRGVEEMFIPYDPPEGEEQDSSPQRPQSYDPGKAVPTAANPDDGKKGSGQRKPLTKGQEKIRREQDTRMARKKIYEGIEGWAKLFRGDKGKPYFAVGKVKREEGWLEKLPKRELCESAKKSRPKRQYD